MSAPTGGTTRRSPRRLRRAAPPRLSRSRRVALALEVLRAYATVRVVVRRGPITQTVATLRRTNTPDRPDDPALGRHLAWATVKTISLLPADSRCLMRALVLTRVMARRGLRSEFVLSASTASSFEAHAWIEHAGAPLLEPGGDDHQALLRL